MHKMYPVHGRCVWKSPVSLHRFNPYRAAPGIFRAHVFVHVDGSLNVIYFSFFLLWLWRPGRKYFCSNISVWNKTNKNKTSCLFQTLTEKSYQEVKKKNKSYVHSEVVFDLRHPEGLDIISAKVSEPLFLPLYDI